MSARIPLTEIAQEAWKEFLYPGALALDATAGNGHDTLFLANQVGSNGRVFSIDIQDTALQTTSGILHTAGLKDRVTLIQGDHGKLERLMIDLGQDRLDLICFNLGYLPGGDHGIATSVETTIPALEASVHLLHPSGLLSVIAYRGHPGGMEESRSVEAFLASLPDEWKCLNCLETGDGDRPGPVLWLYSMRCL